LSAIRNQTLPSPFTKTFPCHKLKSQNLKKQSLSFYCHHYLKYNLIRENPYNQRYPRSIVLSFKQLQTKHYHSLLHNSKPQNIFPAKKYCYEKDKHNPSDCIASFRNCQTLPQCFPYGYTIKSTVARVIDGDTFVLSDSTHVRMLGINTPEIARQRKPSEPFADSAAHFVKTLIEGKQIKLTIEEFSPFTKGGNTKGVYDIFGRLLAYVWLTDANGKDSLFIQAELLKAGLARISHYPKGKRYYDLFYNLRRTARRQHLGIWSND